MSVFVRHKELGDELKRFPDAFLGAKERRMNGGRTWWNPGSGGSAQGACKRSLPDQASLLSRQDDDNDGDGWGG